MRVSQNHANDLLSVAQSTSVPTSGPSTRGAPVTPDAPTSSVAKGSASRTTSTGTSAALALQTLPMVGPKTKARPVDPFWAQTEPVKVGPANERVALMYSHDSELALHDVARFLRSDAETAHKFDELFGHPELAVTRETLAKCFGLTKKQVESFAIRRGVKLGEDDKVPLSALNPRYIKTAFRTHKGVHGLPGPVTAALKGTQALVTELLARRAGIAAPADIEDGDIEIRHPSAEARPRDFYTYMCKLHAELPMAQSHLHVGIPEVIPFNEALYIAASVEAKLTLQRLAVTFEMETPLPYYGSLFNYYITGDRGMIKIQSEAFTQPSPAHDFEVRQWLDIDHGMELLAMAARMTQEHDKLATFSGKDFGAIVHAYGAVAPVLAFVATQLERSDDSALRALVPELRALADEGAKTFAPRGFLEKTHILLNETKLADKLNAATFLVH